MARYKSQALSQDKGLTPIGPKPRAQKEQDFVLLYFKGKSGIQAAKEAGYTGPDNYLAVQASQLLRKPNVAAMLASLRQRAQERTEITADKLLRELAKIGFANMKDFVSLDADGNPRPDLSDLSEDDWAAIEELTTETYIEGAGPNAREVKRVKIKLHPKLAAIEKAMKHLGMFDKRRSGDADDQGDEPQQISYTLNIAGGAQIQFKGAGQPRGKEPLLIEGEAEEE